MKTIQTKALRFQHLHLENWRNFASADADLQSRVFLVGPNASGKSNLLDVFRFLRNLVSVGGGFQDAVQGIRGGVSKLRSLSARRYPDILIRVRIGSDEVPGLWEYELAFSQDNQRKPVVRRESVTHQGQEIWRRPDDDDKGDPQRLTQTYLEQITRNKDVRQIAEFLRSVHYLHVVPQLVREPDRSFGKRDDPFGGDFLEQLAKTPEKTRDAWLKRIKEALRVAVPQLGDLEFFRDSTRGTPHLRGKYQHWRPQGAWQQEDQFSDGTLRLIGLLWAVLEGSGPLLLEEPELSLNDAVVSQLPAVFSKLQSRTGRQVILSTHSASLLTDPGIGVDEVLLLLPKDEGTSLVPAGKYGQIAELVGQGLSLAEAVLPHTVPPRAERLGQFGL